MENINDLVKYDVTNAAIAQYREELMPLTINGIEDKEGYFKVNEARLFIKGERVSVEKTRKELKEDSLAFGRAVDAEAKRITAGLSEIEEHLEAEKKRIDDEVARIKFENEQRERLPERVKSLEAIGETATEDELLRLDDTQFAELLNRLTAAHLERQAADQARRERELEVERRKVEDDRRAIEQAKLEAEREKTRQAELEEARKEAAERARREAELEAARKENARIEADRQAKLEAERVEAEKPDNDKLKSLAIFFETSIAFPDVSSKKALARLVKVRKLVDDIVNELRAA
jgi:hypothetical protein